MPWLAGAAFKDALAQYSNTALACTYVRDRGSGHVTIDKDGKPRLHYTIAPYDQKSIWKVSRFCAHPFIFHTAIVSIVGTTHQQLAKAYLLCLMRQTAAWHMMGCVISYHCICSFRCDPHVHKGAVLFIFALSTKFVQKAYSFRFFLRSSQVAACR